MKYCVWGSLSLVLVQYVFLSSFSNLVLLRVNPASRSVILHFLQQGDNTVHSAIKLHISVVTLTVVRTPVIVILLFSNCNSHLLYGTVSKICEVLVLHRRIPSRVSHLK